MITYHGTRKDRITDIEAWKDDGTHTSTLNPRNDVRNHSPDGVNWGYGGSGAAQLAIALLADVFDSEIALEYYQSFKNEVVARLGDNWCLTEFFIYDWVSKNMRCCPNFSCRDAEVVEEWMKEDAAWGEDDSPDRFTVTIMVPVLTCTLCKESLTDFRDDDIRTAAINSQLRGV